MVQIVSNLSNDSNKLFKERNGGREVTYNLKSLLTKKKEKMSFLNK